VAAAGARDDNGLFSGMPWWVRAVTMIGAPAAIALYLTWFLTSGVSQNLATMRVQTEQHIHDMERHTMETTLGLLELRRYLLLICQNTAKTDIDRAGCNQVR
jgi:hypothetical protein